MLVIFLSKFRRKEQISKPVLLTVSRTCQVVSQKKREKQKETRVKRSGGYLIELGCSLRRSLCCGNFVPLPHGVPIQVALRSHDVDDPAESTKSRRLLQNLENILVTKSYVFLRADTYLFTWRGTYRINRTNGFFIDVACFYMYNVTSVSLQFFLTLK